VNPAPVSEYVPWKYKAPTPVVVEPLTLPNFFRRILDDKEDFVATVYGQKRIGKSESTIQLCRQICPEFDLEEDVVFSLEDFYDTMKSGEQKRWRVKILDDFGSEMDPIEGMFDVNRHTKQYFETSGTFCTGAFITTPNPKFISKDMRDRLADFFIDIKTKNEVGGFCTGIIHYIQRNNKLGKNYYHSLRFSPLQERINNKGIGYKIWNYVFYPPPPEVSVIYKPLRAMKGERNLERGKADFRKMGEQKKSVEEIVEEIFADQGEYTQVKKSGKIYVDKGLVAYKFNLGQGNLLKVISLVKKKLGETNINTPDKPP
jgi:hypothetical protein